MKHASIRLVLASDTHLGKGEGVAGFVDSEVQHDQYGCPYLGGRALKGLLEEECANILFNLGYPPVAINAAQALFGGPGSGYADQPIMHIGMAALPDDLRIAIKIGIERKDFTRQQILTALTTIRRMTSQDYERMAPKDKSLRSIRLIKRRSVLFSHVSFRRDLNPEELCLLIACVAGLRRIGGGRNRGHGKLQEAVLLSEDSKPMTFTYLSLFSEVAS